MRGPVPVYPNVPVHPGHAPFGSKDPADSKAAGFSSEAQLGTSDGQPPFPGLKLLTSCKNGFTPGMRPTRQPCANWSTTWHVPERIHMGVPREYRMMGLISHPPTR